jgi:Ca2+:H+ antiporter
MQRGKSDRTLRSSRLAILAEEWFLLPAGLTSLAFAVFGDRLLAGLDDPLWLTLVFAWLFAIVLGSALNVVRHAEHIAVRMGEPYGTLVLTLAVASIEVMSISAVMLHGESNPTLVRDSLLAVIMIVLNGMVGLSLLVGGWRFGEQTFNLYGANTYLGVVIPLAVLGLVLPNYTITTESATLSASQEVLLGISAIALYAIFIALQTGRQRSLFDDGRGDDPIGQVAARPLLVHALLMFVFILQVVLLADELARPIDQLIETMHAPAAIGGVVLGLLVATPEGISAVRAAAENRMQRSMNIFLGSVLSTIGLTIPAMICVVALTGHELVLGVEDADLVLLLLTLGVSVVTFASGRTHVLQGAVHLVLFLFFLLLIFRA